LYFCFLVDRSSERIVMVGSAQGGMEIEELAEKPIPTRSPKFISNLPWVYKIIKRGEMAFALVWIRNC